MSFLRTLIQPDHEENSELALIGNAANILQIGEFQLLQLAYFEWHNREMSDTFSHKVFQAYMVDGQVPHWAQKFAQRVADATELDEIDINHEYFHRYDQDLDQQPVTGVGKFIAVSTLILGLLGGGLVISHYSAREAHSLLPPYFDDRDFQGKKGPIKKNSSVLPWQGD